MKLALKAGSSNIRLRVKEFTQSIFAYVYGRRMLYLGVNTYLMCSNQIWSLFLNLILSDANPGKIKELGKLFIKSLNG